MILPALQICLLILRASLELMLLPQHTTAKHDGTGHHRLEKRIQQFAAYIKAHMSNSNAIVIYVAL